MSVSDLLKSRGKPKQTVARLGFLFLSFNVIFYSKDVNRQFEMATLYTLYPIEYFHSPIRRIKEIFGIGTSIGLISRKCVQVFKF